MEASEKACFGLSLDIVSSLSGNRFETCAHGFSKTTSLSLAFSRGAQNDIAVSSNIAFLAPSLSIGAADLSKYVVCVHWHHLSSANLILCKNTVAEATKGFIWETKTRRSPLD